MWPQPARSLLVVLVVGVVASACSPAAESEQLTVYGPYVGTEADIFARVLDSFEEETGIPVSYIGSGGFQRDFEDRVNTASLADITLLPQIALLPDLIENDLLTRLDAETSDEVIEIVGPEWAAIVAPDGDIVGIPYRFVMKSLVWYRPDVFTEEGYEIPETIAELKALVRRIIGDGHTPWCGGMDAAGATGWWGTDWVEDLVARRSPQIYYSWAGLDTPFTDGAIVDAMRELQDLMFRPGAVNGGPRAILNVRVEDAIDPMFSDVPDCLMYKQASFQPLWFPDGVEFDDDETGVFPLPGVEPGPPPVVLSGEIAVSTSDNPVNSAFLRYLLSDEAVAPWREAGGSIVVRSEPAKVPPENPLDARLAEILEVAPAVFYDASDAMPRTIGTGTFFQGMIDLIAGRSASEVARQIQDAVDDLEG